MNNFTDLDSNCLYNLTFNFSCLENPLLNLSGEKIKCTILFNKGVQYNFTTLTSSYGNIYFLITPDDSSNQCEIILLLNSSRIYNTISFHYEFNIISKEDITINYGKILIISLISVLVCSALVYTGIWFYKKKLKRSYPIHKIKL